MSPGERPGEHPGDNRGADGDLRARLRAGDPAASLPPVENDRVRRLLEATMAHDVHSDPSGAGPGPGAGPAWWRRWPVAVAAAAVLVLGGVVGGLALTGDDEPGPAIGASDVTSSRAPSEPSSEPSSDASPGAESLDPDATASPEGDGLTALSLAATAPPPNLRCRLVTVEALAGMETAFEGTVTSVGSEMVTFEVERWYAGGDVDVVEVLDPAGLGAAMEGPPDFEPGQRFLVTASGGQVSGCGFSAPYSERLERMFEGAFS